MLDCGFGRCDGHHKMIDFGLRKKVETRGYSGTMLPLVSINPPGANRSRQVFFAQTCSLIYRPPRDGGGRRVVP